MSPGAGSFVITDVKKLFSISALWESLVMMASFSIKHAMLDLGFVLDLVYL